MLETYIDRSWLVLKPRTLLLSIVLVLLLHGCKSWDRVGAGGHIKVDGLVAYIAGVELEFWIGAEKYHDTIEDSNLPLWSDDGPIPDSGDELWNDKQWLEERGDAEG